MKTSGLAFLSASCCWLTAVYANLQSSVLVHAPKKIADSYPHFLAPFGKAPVMGGVMDKVYYYPDDSCDHIDRKGGFPVRPGPDNTTQPFVTPFILLLDRSDNCDFVQQARTAQNAGAAALGILDNRCMCEDTDCQPADNCQSEHPDVIDDGSGADISIPVVLLRKEAGTKFKDLLKTGTGILLQIRFDAPDDTIDKAAVDFHLWTTPVDAASRYIVNNVKIVAEAFNEHAVAFQPHQYLIHGLGYLKCGQPDADPACHEFCTNSGRYCAITDTEKNISGTEIVAESLRRICIRETHKGNKGEAWWKYVAHFQHHCYHSDDAHNHKFTDKGCIHDAMKYAGVDQKAVDDCMDKSGGLAPQGDANTKLDEELLVQKHHGITRLPAAAINDRILGQSPTALNTLMALCDELEHQPTVCHECSWCYDDVVGCIELGSCQKARKRDEQPKRKTHHFITFVHWMFWMMILGGLAYAAWVYSHRYNSSVPTLFSGGGGMNQGPSSAMFMEQSRGILSDYMQLNMDEVNPSLDDFGQQPHQPVPQQEQVSFSS